MRQFSIERSLHILGPVLGKKRGVEVGSAVDRRTDGNTIWRRRCRSTMQPGGIGLRAVAPRPTTSANTDFAVTKGEGLVGALPMRRRHPHRLTGPPGISGGRRKKSSW
jgi:hypothetical protein